MASDPWAGEHPLVRRALAECPPRFATMPTPGAPHLLDSMIVVAAWLGFKLMPWQALVLRVLTEMHPDRRPKYRHAVVMVPRQSGKTALMLIVLIARLMLGWQQVVFAGQSGQAGRTRMTETFWPRLVRYELDLIFGLDLRKGNWPDIKRPESGSRIATWGGSEDANHGDTLDLAVCDEVWKFFDDVLDQSLVPTMRTRRSAQKVDVSTAGTERSGYLLERQRRGRGYVDGGSCEQNRTAYFEWSAPDGADPEDPAVAAACNPGLGYVLDVAEIDSDRVTMSESAFRRTNLNQFVLSDEPWVISEEMWAAVKCEVATPSGGVVMALDAEPTYRLNAVAVACDSRGRAQLADTFSLASAGDETLTDWCVAVAGRNPDVRAFALTEGGLEGVRPKLEAKLGADRVLFYSKSERQAAAGHLHDLVASGGPERLRVESSGPACRFDRALAEATRWPKHGRDAWEFVRIDPENGDISALVALSLAVHAAVGTDEVRRPRLMIR